MNLPSFPVLVLGMHRSGTSYLANVLGALGVNMGEKFLEPDSGNPRGYYEDVSILEFHRKLLQKRAGLSQTRADFLPGPDFKAAWDAAESDEADELLQKLRRPGHWGWKEPRTCLFITQWMSRLPDARFVAVYRHPLEIYYSFLKRRDWSALFFPESIFEAAAIYNEEILSARSLCPGKFLVLHAGASFADAKALAQLLSGFLGLEQAPSMGIPPFAASEFSNLGVVHEQHELMALAYPRAAAAYEKMQAVAERPSEFAADACQTPIPAEEIGRLAKLFEATRRDVGHEIVDSLCMNVPAAEMKKLKDAIAAAVDAQIMKLSAERDNYIANFEKYKGMYDNYFEAWKGTERTLAETRDWINRELLPKIERFGALLRENNIAAE
jgi:hypothetical protein